MSERVCRAIRVEIQPVPLPPGHTEIREFVTWPFEPPKEGQLVYLHENGFPIDDLTLQAGQLITERKTGQTYRVIAVRLFICTPSQQAVEATRRSSVRLIGWKRANGGGNRSADKYH